MQYSPAIPFVGATQNNVKHPNDLKPGEEFVRLTMYTGEHDPVPSWPWPTYTWGIDDTGTTLHGASTTVGGVTFHPTGSASVNCADWFKIGDYLVGVAPTFSVSAGLLIEPSGTTIAAQIFGPDVIVWDAPGPLNALASTSYPGTMYNLTYPYGVGFSGAGTPNVWDVSWIIKTTLYPAGFAGGTVVLFDNFYTGAGSEGLAGVTTLRYAVVAGMTAALFDDDGIGHISYTGDWNIPFDYYKRAAGYVTCGWPINVGGWIYFVDRGGRMFRTDGNYVIEIEGPINIKMIPEVSALGFTWPDTLTNAENWMQFDSDLHRLVFNVRYLDSTVKSAGLAMVSVGSVSMYGQSAGAGAFQFLPDTTNIGADAALPRIETGGIKLTEPANRTQVFYADIDFEIEGSPASYSAVPDGPITLGSTGNDIQSLGIYNGFETVVLQGYIDLGSNTITFLAPHGFTNGQQVVYNAHGGSPISGLVDHSTYYVIYVSDSAVQLSQTATVTSGTSLVLAATNAFDGTMSDGPDTYILTSGRQTVRCALNLTVDRVPRFRITLNGPPNGVKCRVWGFQRIAFDVNGELP